MPLDINDNLKMNWRTLDVLTFGDYVEDSISGFCGIVTAETRYANGTSKFCVEARELDNGKLIAEYWFDHYRLKVKPLRSKGGAGYAITEA